MVAVQLRGRDITNERVLSAMERVPRHGFVPAAMREAAYSDEPLPIGKGQTISQPFQELLVIEKRADGTVSRRSVAPVRFVPMTGEAQKRFKDSR